MIRRVRQLHTPPQTPPVPPPVGADLDACYRYCEAFTRAHHENFPVASVFLPERLRRPVFALYAFARIADDIVDEPEHAGRRELTLAEWGEGLERCYHGEAEHPVFVALADTVRRFELPITPLRDLLSAFETDLSVRRFPTWNDLSSYVGVAARPIGRLLLYVFGDRDPEHHRFAEELSSALALTSFWQDLARDLDLDRVYVPQEDLRHFGLDDAALFARQPSTRLEALIRYECARTRACYERARPLMDLVTDDLGVEIALFWHGGSRMLDKVEARAGNLFGERARLSATDKAVVVAKALRRRGAGLFSRI